MCDAKVTLSDTPGGVGGVGLGGGVGVGLDVGVVVCGWVWM